MSRSGNSVDRVAGRVYSRIMAVVTGLISIGMAGLAAVHWALAVLVAHDTATLRRLLDSGSKAHDTERGAAAGATSCDLLKQQSS
jgi:hypothetical protein